MITETFQVNGSVVGVHADGTRKVRTYYCKSTDTKPIKGVRNASMLYLMDWNSLSDAEKAAAVAQVWMFDEDEKKWLPQ